MPSNETQFKPGQPKPAGSGRQPGTPNHRNVALNNDLAEVLGAHIPHMRTTLDYYMKRERFTDHLTMMVKLLPLVLPRGAALSDLPPETLETAPEAAPPEQPPA